MSRQIQDGGASHHLHMCFDANRPADGGQFYWLHRLCTSLLTNLDPTSAPITLRLKLVPQCIATRDIFHIKQSRNRVRVTLDLSGGTGCRVVVEYLDVPKPESILRPSLMLEEKNIRHFDHLSAEGFQDMFQFILEHLNKMTPYSTGVYARTKVSFSGKMSYGVIHSSMLGEDNCWVINLAERGGGSMLREVRIPNENLGQDRPCLKHILLMSDNEIQIVPNAEFDRFYTIVK